MLESTNFTKARSKNVKKSQEHQKWVIFFCLGERHLAGKFGTKSFSYLLNALIVLSCLILSK